MKKYIPLLSIFLICAPLVAFSDENKSADKVSVTNDGVNYFNIVLKFSDNTADRQKLKDRSSLNSNWESIPNNANGYYYRIYYFVDGSNSLHLDCSSLLNDDKSDINDDTRLFTDDNGNPNYIKGDKYTLKTRYGNKYNDSGDEKSTTFCIKQMQYVNGAQSGNTKWIYLGSAKAKYNGNITNKSAYILHIKDTN